MGRVFLDNCQIMGFHSLSKKIEFLRALGWFRMRIFNDKVGENVRKIWGIKAGIWPLQIVNSMLYRILHIKRFSSQWDIGFIRENLPLSRDEREKNARRMLKKGQKCVICQQSSQILRIHWERYFKTMKMVWHITNLPN